MLASVRAAIDRLPEDQRSVLVLVCIEELSYRETADILDIPMGTVMSRLARARAALVTTMEGASTRADPVSAKNGGRRQ
jgi:RNA polymerase sigma-70 factor (ECF subfamily)